MKPELTREQIYEGLLELIPESQRRESTPRVSEMFNKFLDPLIEIQYQEAIEILEGEANNE